MLCASDNSAERCPPSYLGRDGICDAFEVGPPLTYPEAITPRVSTCRERCFKGVPRCRVQGGTFTVQNRATSSTYSFSLSFHSCRKLKRAYSSHNPHEDDHPISSTEEVRFNLFPEANTLAAGAFFVTRSGAQLHAHTFSGANLAYAQSKCKEASASVGRVCFVVDRIFKASDYQTCVGGRAVAGNIPMAVYRGKLDPEDIWQTSPQDLRASGFDLPVYIDGFRTSDAETASPVTNTGSNVSERLGDSPFGADSVLPGSAMRPTGSNNVAGDGSCGPPPNGASPFTRSRASPVSRPEAARGGLLTTPLCVAVVRI